MNETNVEPYTESTVTQEQRRGAWIAVACALSVTALAALASRVAPPKYVATLIGLMFLGATRYFVWGRSDEVVRAHGLALGGLVIPGTPWRTIAIRAARASGWAFATSAIIFGFYAVGFYVYFFKLLGIHPRVEIAMSALQIARAAGSDFFGQLLMVALPEEAFYRGYVQTRVARALKFEFYGVPIVAVLLTSAIFAIGHIATIPNPARLAVFFPSLVFGVLRARTGGIGAGVLFHALCNVYSTALGHAFGLY
jgi:uncharacterized protein